MSLLASDRIKNQTATGICTVCRIKVWKPTSRINTLNVVTYQKRGSYQETKRYYDENSDSFSNYSCAIFKKIHSLISY